MLKTLLKISFTLLSILLILVIVAYAGFRVLIGNALQEQALVDHFEEVKTADLQRLKTIALDLSQRQNKLKNEPNRISLQARDINLAIGHFGPLQFQIPEDAFAKVDIDNDLAFIEVSARADKHISPFYQQQKNNLSTLQTKIAEHFIPLLDNQWLNLRLPLKPVAKTSSDDLVTVEHGPLSIGNITLSQAITDRLVNTVVEKAKQHPQHQLAMGSWKNVHSINIDNDTLHAVFDIPKTGGLQAQDYRALVLKKSEIELIDLYSAELNKIQRSGALTNVLAKLFQVAKQRSVTSADPIAENKAALLALTEAYGGDKLFEMAAQNNFNSTVTIPKPFAIYRRKDLAQQWVLSAGAALATSGPLAEFLDANQQFKALLANRTVSAWSLLAEKAGLRLAEQATKSAKSARRLQLVLSRAKRDSDILPDIARDFPNANDRFSTEELSDLEELIKLYLDQHPLYRR